MRDRAGCDGVLRAPLSAAPEGVEGGLRGDASPREPGGPPRRPVAIGGRWAMADEGRAGGVLPHGESLRRALQWLDTRIREDPSLDRVRLVGEASLRHDLGPEEEEFLLRQWARGV